jgi:hypothetical protein
VPAVKLSALLKQFEAVEKLTDELTTPVTYADFRDKVRALGSLLDALGTYTKPRRGGTVEVDIERYRIGGGAPAFFAEMAWRLLSAATVHRRARELEQRLLGRLGPPDARPPVRDDLKFAVMPRVQYSRQDVTVLQRMVRYLHVRRAYERVKTGQIYIDAVSDGAIPRGLSIARLSRWNLRNLRRALARLTPEEKSFYAAVRALPFRLKHATGAASWTSIVNARMLFSRVSLADWNILSFQSGFTTDPDELEKQDVDFVFFRVEVGAGQIVTRYGDVQVVFDMDLVLEDGWVTLHDMLQPIDSPTLQALRLREDATAVVRRSEYVDPDDPIVWRHTFPGGTVPPRTVHIMHEVFHGPDILDGLTLSMIRDLREVPALQREAWARHQDAGYLTWLIGVLFRVEAKYPSAFRFDIEDIRATHESAVTPVTDAATDPGAALDAHA